LSKAGKKCGVRGKESPLIWEAFRITDEVGIDMMFIENVDQLRFMTEFWTALLGEFRKRGFEVEWVSLNGFQIGSPQRRRRVFMLGRRGRALQTPLGVPSARAGSLGLPGVFSGTPMTPLNFNGGRPPPGEWMIDREAYARSKQRLQMLGNCVIPQQANLAARILLMQ